MVHTTKVSPHKQNQRNIL